MKKYLYLMIIFMIGLVSCSPAYSSAALMVDPETVSTAVSTQATPTTPSLSEPYSIAALQDRTYGDGELTIEYLWERKEEFSRYYITYTSDGLTIHGFVDVPHGDGPFPVVIALHGYIPASEYETLDYSTRYADSIARKGYIVLHPNMRNFPPSDSPGRGRDSLAGYTIDVMNLIALVDEMAGQDVIFVNADMQRLGIWGHSLGGGVALRVATLEDRIKAIVLYGAVSQRYNSDPLGLPIYDLRSIDAPFSIHHGLDDDTVSPAWSETLCNTLEELGKEHECYFYEGQPHTFYRLGSGDALFIQRTVDFFNTYLEN
ncbi:MAG: alpha/beta fold hydrolase [Chloroflexi bacterium]|nr:alpha/beta fold hydrolase [Chloroflexota bacterium]